MIHPTTTSDLDLFRTCERSCLPFQDLQFRYVKYAFQELVESTEFFVQNSPSQFYDSSCFIPAMGADAAIQLQQTNPNEFVLKVNTKDVSDFGFICAKFLEQQELFEEFFDIGSLFDTVVDHCNSMLPYPGFPASYAKLSNSPQIDDLFQGQEDCSCTDELRENGFAVLENGPKSTGSILASQDRPRFQHKNGFCSFLESRRRQNMRISGGKANWEKLLSTMLP